jgi:HAD superfamily hydrolase (TIGR01509 family)
MELQALIFDVDGTVADTEEAHRQAFNEAFRRHGLDWHWSRNAYATLARVSGGRERLGQHLDSLALPTQRKAELASRIADIHRTKVDVYNALVTSGGVRLRAGVRRLIEEALQAGLKLAVATTGTAESVGALLAYGLGTDLLGRFQVIAAGGVVSKPKPAPDIYRYVLERLQVPAAACIAFEDSAKGVAAARAAGLFVVATPTFCTLDQDFSQADLLLPTLGEADRPLPAAIAAHRTGGVPFVNLALLARLHAAGRRDEAAPGTALAAGAAG